MIAITSVAIEITFSDPLSLVFAKMFILEPPVIAPEAPFDLPPCNKVKIIMIIETIIKTISIKTHPPLKGLIYNTIF
jgi:hypothetical protein